MKATQVQTKPEPVNGAKPCSGPGCEKTTDHPYAMEAGNKVFCQRACWEAYRHTQPVRFPAGSITH